MEVDGEDLYAEEVDDAEDLLYKLMAASSSWSDQTASSSSSSTSAAAAKDLNKFHPKFCQEILFCVELKKTMVNEEKRVLDASETISVAMQQREGSLLP